MRSRIRALVPSVDSADLHLRAEGTITRLDGRYRLKLVVSDSRSSGERVIESASCSELAGAAAVALMLLARVGSSGGTPDIRNGPTPAPANDTTSKPSGAPPTKGTGQSPAPADTKPPEPPPAGPAKAPQPEPPADETLPVDASRATVEGRSWRILLRAPLVSGDIGPLPSPSIGYGLGVGLKIDEWRLLLSGHISSQRAVWSKDIADYGAEVGRATADLSVCRALLAGRLELAACVALTLERMTARGVGDHIAPDVQYPTWFGAGAAVVGYWYPWSWMAFFVDAGGRVETSRPHIELDQVGPVFQVAPAALTLAVGSEWIF